MGLVLRMPPSVLKKKALFYTLALAFLSFCWEPSMELNTGNTLITKIKSPDTFLFFSH